MGFREEVLMRRAEVLRGVLMLKLADSSGRRNALTEEVATDL